MPEWRETSPLTLLRINQGKHHRGHVASARKLEANWFATQTEKQWKTMVNNELSLLKRMNQERPFEQLLHHRPDLIECFHSCGQHICKFIGTKESVYIRKEFNSHRTDLGHQYGRRDVMWKHSIKLSLKTVPSAIGFPITLQAAHFSTKNPINKSAMNNRRILIAAVFHFVHPVEKDS